MRRLLAMVCFAVTAASAQTLPNGEYEAEGGWGTMTIAASKLGQTFSIDTLGPNFHSCTLQQGTLQGLRGEAREDGMEERCVIDFKLNGSRVEASPTQACSYFCGMRASLGHVFIKAAPSCARKSREQRRAAFLKSYRAKQYPQAYATLSSMEKECGELLFWMEHDDVRNDLAVTLHKLGRKSECLNLLKETEAFTYLNESAIKENMAPSDADAYMRIARATWTNRRLCEALK